MAKERSRWLDYLVYFGFRVYVCIIQALPASLLNFYVEFVGALAYRFDRRHREVVIENLRRAFPGRYTEAQLASLALRVFQHFFSILVEVQLMSRKVKSSNLHRHVDAREFASIKEFIDSGRPVIVLTAHYGNWELSAHWLGLTGVRSHLVARPIDNPYLDRWLTSIREFTGHEVLSKTGDIRRMTEVLANGETLCTLGDQDAGARGMFVDFFGAPASTHKAIARLAERTGAIITVVGMQKTGSLLNYAIRLMDVIDPRDYAGRPDATLAITQRYTLGIERLIRLDPAQYFWFHRRWKHQPPTSRQIAA